MNERFVVEIDGCAYTVLSEEPEAHLRALAEMVDKDARAIRDGARFSRLAAMTLTALRMADKYVREQKAADHLRQETQAYATENAELRRKLRAAARAQGPSDAEGATPAV